jgi:hypothetical protein
MNGMGVSFELSGIVMPLSDSTDIRGLVVPLVEIPAICKYDDISEAMGRTYDEPCARPWT